MCINMYMYVHVSTYMSRVCECPEHQAVLPAYIIKMWVQLPQTRFTSTVIIHQGFQGYKVTQCLHFVTYFPVCSPTL